MIAPPVKGFWWLNEPENRLGISTRGLAVSRFALRFFRRGVTFVIYGINFHTNCQHDYQVA